MSVTWLSLCHVLLLIARRKYMCIYIYIHMCVPVFPRVMSSTYRKARRGCFEHMSVPGFPSVMSFYLSHGEKGLVLAQIFVPACLLTSD